MRSVFGDYGVFYLDGDFATKAETLEAARAMAEKLVLVLRHAEYYPRFGFRPASTLGIWPSFDAPDDAMMALALDPGAEIPRGTIVYPAPFGV